MITRRPGSLIVVRARTVSPPRWSAYLTSVAASLVVVSAEAQVLPQGGKVVAGAAAIRQSSPSSLSIQQSSSRSVINWNSFSIGAGNTVTFTLPAASAATLNRVTGSMSSIIAGQLHSNGSLYLINPNGIQITPTGTINTESFTASALGISTQDFLSGKYQFTGNGSSPAVTNDGLISVAPGGSALLLGSSVTNRGTILAPGGKVGLGAGEDIGVDLEGDQFLTVSVPSQNVPLLRSLITQSGRIVAKGGSVALRAATTADVARAAIQVSGSMVADGASAAADGGVDFGHPLSANGGTVSLDGGPGGAVEVGGQIIATSPTASGGSISITGQAVTLQGATLDASGATGGGSIRVGGDWHGQGTLPAAQSTVVDAGTSLRADAGQSGNGGSVVLWSDNTTTFNGQISARGGTDSGDGGTVEVSSHQLLNYAGLVDLLAPHGQTGSLLLDPENVTIQTNSGVPTDTCAGGVCTPPGDNSILTVAALESALSSSNVTVNTGSTGSQTGNITVANSLTWSNGNLLLLSAAGGITISSGATISNTYTGGTFGAGSIPVVLALRADSTSAVNASGVSTNNYGVTNLGTIDMSGSSGAVSIFNDSGFTTANGVETANGSWTAPSNRSVSGQFTTYKLVNGVGDLAAIGTNSTTLGHTYALGRNINGGGAAFNSNTPLGTFTGIFDGEFCALTGGSSCSVTGLTLTSAAATVGLFGTVGSAGIVRNLGIGLTVSDTDSSTTQVGDLVGANNGIIANVAATGAVSYTGTSGTVEIGGLVGLSGAATGTITNSAASGAVTYNHTSAAAGTAYVGGLVGYNNIGAANSISGSSATGVVTAQYGSGGSGSVTGVVGGLVGDNVNTSSTAIVNSNATGNVSDTLNGAIQFVGGLAGYSSGTISGTSTATSYASGTVSASPGGNTASTVYLGGLVGQTGGITGIITNSAASGAVTYTYAGTAAATSAADVGGLVGYNGSTATPSISGASSTGNVTAQYGSGYSGNITADVGGLVGNNGGALASSSPAAVSVTDTLGGSGAQSIGWLAGYNSAAIANVSNNTTSVSYTGAASTVYIGGLVGQNTGAGGTITNATVTGSVTYSDTSAAAGSNAYVGGLVGYNSGSAANSISGSSATGGKVTAQYGSGGSGSMTGYVGGLVGDNANTSSSSIVNSYSSENVNDALNVGAQRVGGLAGYSGGTISGTSTASSYASGTVAYTGTAGTVYIGGLVGQNNTATGIITNSAATGSVTYSDTSAAAGTQADVGGLVGYNSGSAAHSISGSSATGGTVTAQYGSGGSGSMTSIVGGLIGYNTNTSSSAIVNAYSSENINDTLNGAATTQYVGGLVGDNNGTITGISTATSYASGTVAYTGTAGTADVGGVAGYSTGAIVNTAATGAVSDTGTTGIVYIGGLVGQNGAGGIITNSAATGSVTYSYTSAAAGTQADVGGLVGYNSGSAANSISGSNATGGTVTAQYGSGGSGGLTGFVGGLVGENANTSGTAIVNSYATENVNDTLSGGIQSIGGLAGYSDGSISGTSTASSYASGTVAYIGPAGTVYLGGLVGQNAAATGIITNSAATGSVTYDTSAAAGSNAYVGGLVGFNSSTAASSISGASSSGNVTAEYGSGDSANITGYVAGLVGESGNDGATAISTSFAAGNVSSDLSGGNEYVGGLIGYNYSTSASAIANAYAIGSVSYTGTTASAETAGLVGYNRSGSISDTYATGYVNASAGTAGGLVASNGGTLSASYWDAGTTGQSGAEAGATSVTTATLQNSGTNGGLPSGWSSSIWAIVPGVSYPYLSWEFPSGTPQVVSGSAYGDRGVTPLAGATVAGLINGSSFTSAQTGGGVTTGANGYYYYLLAPNTIPASGSQVLTYLTGSIKGDAFYDNAAGSLASFNIFGNELLTSSASSALSMVSADLATALGGNSGSDFLFTLNPGAMSATAGANLEFNLTASTLNLDQTLTTSSGGAVIFNDANAVTQSAAISAPNLLLDSGGSYTLTDAANSIGTVAGNTGALSLTDGAPLTVGAVAGTNGLSTTGTVTLKLNGGDTIAAAISSPSGALIISDTGSITQTGGTIATGNLLLSSSGSFSLDQANQIGTLAANVGSLSLTDAQNLNLGTVQGTSGIMASGAITIADIGNLTIASGSQVSGANPALSATGAFINDSAGAAVVATSGRWLIYSATPSGDTFNGLNSQNTALWNTIFAQSPPASIGASGNRYAFAYQPTLTFTSTNTSKPYGVDVTGSIASSYVVSGYQSGVTDAFLGDGAANAFNGAPTVTSSGASASATVTGGPYVINISQGSVTSPANYALSFQSTGLLTVNPAPLTITLSNPEIPAVSYLDDLDPSLTLERVGDQIDWCALSAGSTVEISARTLTRQGSGGKRDAGSSGCVVHNVMRADGDSERALQY